MQAQISIFLYIYLAFLVIWSAFSIVALYHMFKFGFKNFITHFAISLYLLVSLILLGASFYYIVQTDWSINIFNIHNSNPVTSIWE